MVKSIKPRVGTLTLSRASKLRAGTDAIRIRGSRLMAIRAEQLKREPLCRPCSKEEPPRYVQGVEVDHVIPLWEGGLDIQSNRQTICLRCHAAKTAEETIRRASRGGMQ